MENKPRLLIIRSIYVPSEVNLAWLKTNMENKIDATLYVEDHCIEWKEYESDIAYKNRIEIERRFEEFKKNDPDFLIYLELKKKFGSFA